jgi:hypothetical protein
VTNGYDPGDPLVVFASSSKSSLGVSVAPVIRHPSESSYYHFDFVCVFVPFLCDFLVAVHCRL